MKQVFPLSIQSGMSQSGSYILMLCEPVSSLQIPIFIGAYEAQAILLAKETVPTRRPMTHELMVKMMHDYGLSIKAVTIDHVLEGIFYATVHTTDGFNDKPFDSRTSDAITLALLTDSPIMVADDVLEETGVKMEAAATLFTDSDDPKHEIARLEEELRLCEEREEYEQAAEIQKKIEQLKGNQ